MVHPFNLCGFPSRHGCTMVYPHHPFSGIFQLTICGYVSNLQTPKSQIIHFSKFFHCQPSSYASNCEYPHDLGNLHIFSPWNCQNEVHPHFKRTHLSSPTGDSPTYDGSWSTANIPGFFWGNIQWLLYVIHDYIHVFGNTPVFSGYKCFGESCLVSFFSEHVWKHIVTKETCLD
jgi:hypothetical protein